MRLTVGLCILCHDRPLELAEALRSAGTGWDERLVLDMASSVPLDADAGVTLLRSDSNRGVSAGRNELTRAARSDILVFLDDDAVMCTSIPDSVRHRFEAEDDLAVVAFRIVRPDGGTRAAEHPFRGRPRLTGVERSCAYFVGAAYAARREALLNVGGYDESFFYSTEEVDLSLALIRRGWRLLYDPALVVEHRPSVRGREVSSHVPALRLENRIVLARRHLPWWVGAVHVAAWGVRTWREARAEGALPEWRRAWRRGLRRPIARAPLGIRQAVEIHRLGGRVFW